MVEAGTGRVGAYRLPRLAGALMLTLLTAGCSLPDSCLKYLPASARVVPASRSGIDKSDYRHAPIAFTRCRAAGGTVGAQLALAHAYEDGRGVPRDPARAAKWYRRAAQPTIETDFAAPQAGPGEAYGHTIPRASAPGPGPGNAEAQYRLGLLYLDGRGVPQDMARARKWLERAARQGHAAARAKLSELAGPPAPVN